MSDSNTIKSPQEDHTLLFLGLLKWWQQQQNTTHKYKHRTLYLYVVTASTCIVKYWNKTEAQNMLTAGQQNENH